MVDRVRRRDPGFGGVNETLSLVEPWRPWVWCNHGDPEFGEIMASVWDARMGEAPSTRRISAKYLFCHSNKDQ